MAPLTAAGTGASPPLAGDAAPVEAVAAGLGLSVPPPHAAIRAAAAAGTATRARRSRRLPDGRVRRSMCMDTAPSEGTACGGSWWIAVVAGADAWRSYFGAGYS